MSHIPLLQIILYRNKGKTAKNKFYITMPEKNILKETAGIPSIRKIEENLN